MYTFSKAPVLGPLELLWAYNDELSLRWKSHQGLQSLQVKVLSQNGYKHCYRAKE